MAVVDPPGFQTDPAIVVGNNNSNTNCYFGDSKAAVNKEINKHNDTTKNSNLSNNSNINSKKSSSSSRSSSSTSHTLDQRRAPSICASTASSGRSSNSNNNSNTNNNSNNNHNNSNNNSSNNHNNSSNNSSNITIRKPRERRPTRCGADQASAIEGVSGHAEAAVASSMPLPLVVGDRNPTSSARSTESGVGGGSGSGAPDDLMQLDDFGDGDLLSALWSRYQVKEIYTWVGNVLVSVNPYEDVGAFTDEAVALYATPLPPAAPHLFATVNAALSAVGDCHAILVTGESGSGKTEATRGILRFLARRHGGTDPVRERLVQSTPVLEAFGNAHTRQNTNSSRFGKFIEVHLSPDGQLTGATLKPYMLETSRVAGRLPKGEKTYHVFYLLRAAVSASATSDAGTFGSSLWAALSENQEWQETVEACEALLKSSKLTSSDQIDSDVEDTIKTQSYLRRFEELVDGLLGSGLPFERIVEVFRLVAAVSVLAEYNNEDRRSLGLLAVVRAAAKLLRISEGELRSFLSKAEISVGNGGCERVFRERNEQEVSTMRATVAQELYSALFSWLTERVGDGISPKTAATSGGRRLGLLDLYGFEVFDVNGFEQLLINYCNERLQQFFNRQVYAREAEEYMTEGLGLDSDGHGHWQHLSVACQLPAISLLEGSPSSKMLGIFGILNDRSRCSFGTGLAVRSVENSQETNASALVDRLITNCCSHEAFRPGKANRKRCFSVRHFAGEVLYDATEFVEKNASSDRPDILSFLTSHGSEFLNEILACSTATKHCSSSSSNTSGMQSFIESDAKHRRKLFGRTLVSVFQQELNELASTLEARQCRHVRCLRPNDEQTPLHFDDVSMLRQCRYSGLSEAARIRRQGFAHRKSLASFAPRYAMLLPDPESRRQARHCTNATAATCCAAICQITVSSGGAPIGDIRVGRTKVFLTETAFSWLETSRAQSSFQVVATNLAFAVARRRFLKLRRAALLLQRRRRGLLARRAVEGLRAERRRQQFLEFGKRTQLEALARAETAVTVLQRWWRCWLSHRLAQTTFDARGNNEFGDCSWHQPIAMESFICRRQRDSTVSARSQDTTSTILADPKQSPPAPPLYQQFELSPVSDRHSCPQSSEAEAEAESRSYCWSNVTDLPCDLVLHQQYQSQCVHILHHRKYLLETLPPNEQPLLDDLDFTMRLLARRSRIESEHLAFIEATTRRLLAKLPHNNSTSHDTGIPITANDAHVGGSTGAAKKDTLDVTTRCNLEPTTAIVATSSSDHKVVYHNNHPRFKSRAASVQAPVGVLSKQQGFAREAQAKANRKATDHDVSRNSSNSSAAWIAQKMVQDKHARVGSQEWQRSAAKLPKPYVLAPHTPVAAAHSWSCPLQTRHQQHGQHAEGHQPWPSLPMSSQSPDFPPDQHQPCSPNFPSPESELLPSPLLQPSPPLPPAYTIGQQQAGSPPLSPYFRGPQAEPDSQRTNNPFDSPDAGVWPAEVIYQPRQASSYEPYPDDYLQQQQQQQQEHWESSMKEGGREVRAAYDPQRPAGHHHHHHHNNAEFEAPSFEHLVCVPPTEAIATTPQPQPQPRAAPSSCWQPGGDPFAPPSFTPVPAASSIQLPLRPHVQNHHNALARPHSGSYMPAAPAVATTSAPPPPTTTTSYEPSIHHYSQSRLPCRSPCIPLDMDFVQATHAMQPGQDREHQSPNFQQRLSPRLIPSHELAQHPPRQIVVSPRVRVVSTSNPTINKPHPFSKAKLAPHNTSPPLPAVLQTLPTPCRKRPSPSGGGSGSGSYAPPPASRYSSTTTLPPSSSQQTTPRGGQGACMPQPHHDHQQRLKPSQTFATGLAAGALPWRQPAVANTPAPTWEDLHESFGLSEEDQSQSLSHQQCPLPW